MKNKEDLLTVAIQSFGFEHPYTISIARAIENNVSFDTIKATLEGLLEMGVL